MTTVALVERARLLRRIAAVTMWLWAGTAAAFVVVVGFDVDQKLVSAFGVIASTLFTAWFALNHFAARMEMKAVAARIALENAVISSTTRRGRPFVPSE